MRGGGVVLKPVVGGGARDKRLDCPQDVELEDFSRLSSFLEDSINCHRDHLATLQQRGWGPDDVVNGGPMDQVWEVPFEATRPDLFSPDDTCSEPSTESSAICPLIPSMSSSQGGPSTLSPVTAHFPFQAPHHELFYGRGGGGGDTLPLPHTQEMLPTPKESPIKLQSLLRSDEHGCGNNAQAKSSMGTQSGDEGERKIKEQAKIKRTGMERFSRIIRGWNRKVHE